MRRDSDEEEPGSSLLASLDQGFYAEPWAQESSSSKKLAHEIGQHLALLKKPLPVVNPEGLMVSSTQIQGWLWVQRGYRGWKKRWFLWRYSDVHEQWNLYSYKSPDHVGTSKLPAIVPGKVKSVLRTQNDDPSAKSLLKVTFARREEFNKKQQETNLEAMQKSDQVPTSKTYLRVFTRKSVVMLAAADDDEVSRWEGVITTYIKDLLGPQYDSSAVVAEEVSVLLKQQYSGYLAKCQDLLNALEQNGLFEDAWKHKRDKSGTLLVESGSAEDGWRKHRFVLQGKVLYHWPSDKGHKFIRAIPLKFATIEHDPDAHPDDQSVFQITTPLISYVVKAKHKVAMEEWVNAIERNKAKPKLSTGEKISESVKGVAAALAHFQLGGKHEELYPDGVPLLSFSEAEGESLTCNVNKPGGRGSINPKNAVLVVTSQAKQKSYNIKKPSMTVGRSSVNEIVVNDSRLSREHCSIDTVGDKLVFCDMGSKGGSKINKVRVTDRTVLQAGDLIKVGKTTILVLNK